MKKLLKKVLMSRKEKLPTQDHIAILISRLCDPTDVIYDENFAKGMQEEYENRKSR
jgi:hypothetical protein